MLRRTAVVFSLLVAGCSDPSWSPPATPDVNVQPPATSGVSEDETGAPGASLLRVTGPATMRSYTMRLMGHRRAQESVPLRLTFNPGNDGGPHWSPNGRRIAFYSARRHLVGRVIVEQQLMELAGAPAPRLPELEDLANHRRDGGMGQC
jgi:Tol biopolymer transport system component